MVSGCGSATDAGQEAEVAGANGVGRRNITTGKGLFAEVPDALAKHTKTLDKPFAECRTDIALISEGSLPSAFCHDKVFAECQTDNDHASSSQPPPSRVGAAKVPCHVEAQA